MSEMMSALPLDYKIQDEYLLRQTLSTIESVCERLGGKLSDWSVKEVGDGNLNLVFIVKGASGGVAVKQALPYVRMVGESWPLPLARSYYEHMALAEHVRICPGLAPAILHYDTALSLLVMELLEPHIVMRYGLVDGATYPDFAETIGTFLARTLFLTSDLAVPAAEKKQRIAAFAGNTAMCNITEDLIFDEPYYAALNNRWTTPQLDGIAQQFRDDTEVKIAAARLKLKFLTTAQALLHGDLHTGSIMVTDHDTRVIDAEFAFYGPMGFDIGMLIANLLMAYLAQDGHETQEGERDACRNWILSSISGLWHRFQITFMDLWHISARGDAYPAKLFADRDGQFRLELERQRYIAEIFRDAVGFAGAEIVRRILGLAHTAELEAIADPDIRADCEARALRLARGLIVDPERYPSIETIVDAAILARETGQKPAGRGKAG